eukprot:scaffold57720_cov17-Tisochrysis_lutea.AAC.2
MIWTFGCSHILPPGITPPLHHLLASHGVALERLYFVGLVTDLWDAKSKECNDNGPAASRAELEEMTRRVREANSITGAGACVDAHVATPSSDASAGWQSICSAAPADMLSMPMHLDSMPRLSHCQASLCILARQEVTHGTKLHVRSWLTPCSSRHRNVGDEQRAAAEAGDNNAWFLTKEDGGDSRLGPSSGRVRGRDKEAQEAQIDTESMEVCVGDTRPGYAEPQVCRAFLRLC